MTWAWDKGKEGTQNSPPPSWDPSSSHNEPDCDYSMLKWRWDQNQFASCILERLKRVHTKTLNYAQLADTEQGEKKAPDKFLDRLQEALHKFSDFDPKSTEEGIIWKIDSSLSQLQISAISYENRHLDQISL